MRKNLGSINYKIPSLLLLSVSVIAACSSNSSSEPETVTPTESGADGALLTSTNNGTIAIDSDTGTMTNTDSGATVTSTDADSGTATGTDSGTTETDTDSETATNTDSSTTETDTDSGTETNTDSDTTETGTDNGSETGPDAGTAGGTDTGPSLGTSDTGPGGISTSSPVTVGAANCSALSAVGSSASIAGLYEYSDTSDTGQVDVAYLDISTNGTMTIYDYQQDEINQGDNCYTIVSGISVLSPLENNEFVRTYYINSDVDCELATQQGSYVRNDAGLTRTYVDIDDDDKDGDSTDLVSEVLSAVTGITTKSFNRCE